MSREQRRADRRQQSRATGGRPPPSRRTPVRAPGGSGPPWTAIGIAVGTVAIAGLIIYLVTQQGNDSGGDVDAAATAAANQDPSLPGEYVADQGRGHFTEPHSLTRLQTPFCDGVERSDIADSRSRATPTARATGTGTARASTGTPATPAPTTPATTAATTGTPAGNATATGTPTPTAAPTDCFLSNPPSSGRHLGAQRRVEVQPGIFTEIPPQNVILPQDVELPRDAIPHVLEHASVFIGWNCEGLDTLDDPSDDDAACFDVVAEVESLASDRIENNDNRVVVGPDRDLPVGTIGAVAWTRVMTFDHTAYEEAELERFIGTHSCRFDPEGFCR